jgi:hypothetical protein
VLGGSLGSLAYDDTYVYWVDDVTVGTVMKALKTGGTATVIARDTDPVAIAVDAKSAFAAPGARGSLSRDCPAQTMTATRLFSGVRARSEALGWPSGGEDGLAKARRARGSPRRLRVVGGGDRRCVHDGRSLRGAGGDGRGDGGRRQRGE